jgi:hypothetical protein
MARLLLNSIWIATSLLPVLAASDPNASRGLRKAIVWFVGYNAFYQFGLRFVLPHLQ